MYAGEAVKESPVRELFKSPKHHYTRGLLSCVPTPPTEAGATVQLSSIPGAVFSDAQPAPDACLFKSRCPIAQEPCGSRAPPVVDTGSGHLSHCLYSGDVIRDIWGEQETNVEIGRSQGKPVLSATGLCRFYGSWGRKYLFGAPDPGRRFAPLMKLTSTSDWDGHWGSWVNAAPARLRLPGPSWGWCLGTGANSSYRIRNQHPTSAIGPERNKQPCTWFSRTRPPRLIQNLPSATPSFDPCASSPA